VTKEQGIHMTISGLGSAIAVLATLWIFAEPIIVESVSVAMASDIEQSINKEIEPLNRAFVALLQRDVNDVRKAIAAMRYRQRLQQDWTSEDAANLTYLEIELEALNEAMEEMKKNRSH